MAEQECDHCSIDSMVEKRHGRTMAQYVRCYLLGLHGGTPLLSNSCVLGDALFHRIRAEGTASDAQEQRRFGLTAPLMQPSLHQCGNIAPKRCSSRFTSFAFATNVRPRSQYYVLATKADEL